MSDLASATQTAASTKVRIHTRNFLCVIRAKRDLDSKVWQQKAITLDTTLLESTDM